MHLPWELGKGFSKQALLQRKPATKANTALREHNIGVNKSIFMFWYIQNRHAKTRYHTAHPET
jgi:hypothetical protein